MKARVTTIARPSRRWAKNRFSRNRRVAMTARTPPETGGETHDDTLSRRARDGPRTHGTDPGTATRARHQRTQQEHVEMDRPEILLAPGPTPIPPEVLLAQGSPLVYHRGPGFGRLMRDVTARLKELYRTETADVLLMTSSGTGGLESAIQNVSSPGDEVLVPLAGFFSERWTRLAEAHGMVVRTVEYDWGRRVVPQEVAAALAE